MKILIIGSGGREHALALKLSEENKDHQIFVSPGNGGTATIADNIILLTTNDILNFCIEKDIDLVVIGPEQPLVDGLADFLRENNINVFGPNRAAAKIEGDKSFSKSLMTEYGVPTAKFKSFSKDEYDLALEYIKSHKFPVVIKASGLAAGKGVIIANSFDEANIALKDIMLGELFGSAGDNVVIEEFLEGEELSVFVVTDGENYTILPVSQDHKRVGEGDTGKNTGGMGAYSPIKFVNNELIKAIERSIIIPTLKGLQDKNASFNGCLYCGLIKTQDGIKVIEFNCRFGDPEIQAVLQLIEGSFSELLLSTALGKTNTTSIKYNGKAAMCVVAVSGGYPDEYKKGYEIIGLGENSDKIKYIHAGTKLENGKLFTNGGRVLNIVGISEENDVNQAKEIAYEAISKINFKDIYFRKDIGHRIFRY